MGIGRRWRRRLSETREAERWGLEACEPEGLWNLRGWGEGSGSLHVRVPETECLGVWVCEF